MRSFGELERKVQRAERPGEERSGCGQSIDSASRTQVMKDDNQVKWLGLNDIA